MSSYFSKKKRALDFSYQLRLGILLSFSFNVTGCNPLGSSEVSSSGGGSSTPVPAASCSLSPGTGSENTAAKILSGYYGWDSSGTVINGSMTNVGAINLSTTSPSVAGYYSSFTNGSPTNSTVCSGTQILGVSGIATCISSMPSVSVAGDLSWGTTSSQAEKTLTFSIATAGSNFAKLSFSGTGTSYFRITEIAGKTVSQLASASDVIVGLTNSGQSSTTIKVKPVFASGVARTMTVTVTDAAGSTQTISADHTITGPTVTNMVFWFKADSGVTYDGSNLVSSWTDSSGNGHDATQATGSRQPLYVASAVNSSPAIRFDGTNDYLAIGGGGFLVSQIYFVFKSVSPSFGWGSVLGNIATNATRPFIFEGGTTHLHNNQYPRNVWQNGSPLSAPYTFSSIQSYMYVTINVNSPATSRSYSIGSSELAYYSNLEIAEIIGYGSDYSNTDQQGIEAYLSGKYGL